MRIYKNRKQKSSMLLPPNPNSLANKLKRVHSRCYFWVNALKSTLPSLNIEFYGSKVRDDYNGVPM